MLAKISLALILHTIIIMMVLNICYSDLNCKMSKCKKLSKHNVMLPLNKRKHTFIEKRLKKNIRLQNIRHPNRKHKPIRRDIGLPLYLSVNPEFQIESKNKILKELVKNSVQEQVLFEPKTQNTNCLKKNDDRKNRRNTNLTLSDTNYSNNTLEALDVLINDLNKLRGSTIATDTVQENQQCDVSGIWLSEAGGVVLDIRSFRELLQVDVYSSPPKSAEHTILNSNWTITGKAPFGLNSTLILTAENEENKHVAVFIGHCRICERTESIIGQWLINYGTSDCKHFIISQATLGDIFTRTIVPTL